MARKPLRIDRVDLTGERLPFQPRNEAGVTMIFGRYAEDLGFKVIDTQTAFPDCKALYHGRKVAIEFEYRSRNFQTHRHDPKECDLIVCWENVWPGAPRRYRNLPVLELRKFFGIGWKVWLQPMEDWRADDLPGIGQYGDPWSAASQAGPDDLVLVYWKQPAAEIRHILRISSPVERRKATWKKGDDWMSEIQTVARLDRALDLDDLAKILSVPRKNIGRAIQGRRDVTAAWPAFSKLLVRRNPAVRTVLTRYGPSRARGT